MVGINTFNMNAGLLTVVWLGVTFTNACSTKCGWSSIYSCERPPRISVTTSKYYKCGVSTVDGIRTRIVGGEEAQSDEIPWQVALVWRGDIRPFCGGTLLSSRTVLTAAHCMTGRLLFIETVRIRFCGFPSYGMPSLQID